MFGISLKEARRNLAFTQKEVAILLNIHPNTLFHWEKGVSYPTAEQFIALCRIYNCPLDSIFLQQ